jgi:hypothetical protein
MKTMKNLSKGTLIPDRESKPDPFEYEASPNIKSTQVDSMSL